MIRFKINIQKLKKFSRVDSRFNTIVLDSVERLLINEDDMTNDNSLLLSFLLDVGVIDEIEEDGPVNS